MKYNKVNFLTQIISSNQQLKIDNCSGVIFWNQGTTVCTIMQIRLQPGQSFVLNANLGEIIDQQFQVNFAGGVGELTVISKLYTN